MFHFASLLSQTPYLIPTSPSPSDTPAPVLPAESQLVYKVSVNSPSCWKSSIPFLDCVSPPISCCVQCVSSPLHPVQFSSSSDYYLYVDTFVMLTQQTFALVSAKLSRSLCRCVVCALMPPDLKKMK